VEVVIAPTPADVARVAAGAVIDQVRRRPTAVLGLATGSSPLLTYGLLIAAHRAGQVSFAGCHAVLLDEYVGLPFDHSETYRAVIRRVLIDHIDLAPERLHGPDVWAENLAAACTRYDEVITGLGGVDLQLLGIGSDGHVGFNEPGSSLRSRTRVKTLTASTRADNAPAFASAADVPRHVVTQGLGTISEARHLLLIATGAKKAAPLARAVEGPLTARCPASVLQLHPHATVVVDDEAAADLELAGYYRETYAGKPDWQAL
jgi:glucosamine-6-phosphate deaminase